MFQPNFRKMLKALGCCATETRDYLVYQVKCGKPPPRVGELNADLLRSLGFKLLSSPNPAFALLTKWRKIGGLPPVTLVFDNSGDPFYHLFCLAQKVLDLSENHWPAGTVIKETLLALLRPIVTQGGRSGTIADLKRIAQVVKSILSGKPIKEKKPRGPGAELGRVTKVVKNILSGKRTEARKTRGFSLWECPKGTIKVFSRLRPLHDAYLTGEKEHNLAGHDFPYQVSSLLKKLIKSAQEFEFKPDPDRWPRCEKQDDGGMIIRFDAKEDAPGWWRPALRRMGPVDPST